MTINPHKLTRLKKKTIMSENQEKYHITMCEGLKAESVLTEAERIVTGERNADYSEPVDSFNHIASIVSSILNVEVTPYQCCITMIAVKLARENYKHKRDNLVDLAGYTKILHAIRLDELKTK